MPTQIISQIISHTPTWVFALFAALLALGLSQLRTRTASLARVTVMPVAMLLLAVSGVVSAFGFGVEGWLALLVWATGAVLVGRWVALSKNPAGTGYDPVLKQFALPGSVVPLVLIMGIFCTKYAVGVTLVFHPELAQHEAFALVVSGLYGVFSGIFAARALRLWRLTQPRGPMPLAA